MLLSFDGTSHRPGEGQEDRVRRGPLHQLFAQSAGLSVRQRPGNTPAAPSKSATSPVTTTTRRGPRRWPCARRRRSSPAHKHAACSTPPRRPRGIRKSPPSPIASRTSVRPPPLRDHGSGTAGPGRHRPGERSARRGTCRARPRSGSVSSTVRGIMPLLAGGDARSRSRAQSTPRAPSLLLAHPRRPGCGGTRRLPSGAVPPRRNRHQGGGVAPNAASAAPSARFVCGSTRPRTSHRPHGEVFHAWLVAQPPGGRASSLASYFGPRRQPCAASGTSHRVGASTRRPGRLPVPPTRGPLRPGAVLFGSGWGESGTLPPDAVRPLGT